MVLPDQDQGLNQQPQVSLLSAYVYLFSQTSTERGLYAYAYQHTQAPYAAPMERVVLRSGMLYGMWWTEIGYDIRSMLY
eukprot:159852-Rhodomonas_salina.1